MWFTLSLSAETFWRFLPDITIALRFITALIGFVTTANTLRRQLRRRRHRR